MGSPTATTMADESVVVVPKESKKGGCFLADLALRVLLLAATVASVVVLVTSQETKLIPVSQAGVVRRVPLDAKISQSPAFVYLLAAMAAIAFYSIIATLASLTAACKPASSAATLVALAYFDVLALGIAASATGTAGGVAYIGLKGNSHTKWIEICSTYDGFCKHVGASIALSLVASIILAILLQLAIFALYSKIRRTNC